MASPHIDTEGFETIIYALLHPDAAEPYVLRDVRYVGQTMNVTVRSRLWAHYSDASQTPKAQWIRELAAEGKRPKMRVLEVIRSGTLWEGVDNREERWIAYLLHTVKAQLTNVARMPSREYEATFVDNVAETNGSAKKQKAASATPTAPDADRTFDPATTFALYGAGSHGKPALVGYFPLGGKISPGSLARRYEDGRKRLAEGTTATFPGPFFAVLGPTTDADLALRLAARTATYRTGRPALAGRLARVAGGVT